MKTIRIILAVIVFLVMILLTAICYIIPEPSLTGGSILQAIVYAQPIYPTVFLIAFGCFMAFYLYNPTSLKLIPASLCILLWFLSGREVCITLINTKVMTGWFYTAVNDYNPCASTQYDCETIINQNTTTEKLSFWRIRIKNNDFDEIIFVGPFIWDKTVKMFSEQIGTSYTSK
jgi:hypothetical protein